MFDEQMKALCPTVPEGVYWQRLLAEGHQQRLEAALGVVDAFETWKPGDTLQTIRCPKLVIGGEKDILCNLTVVNRAAAALGADMVIIHGVGHGPIIENTERFLTYMVLNIRTKSCNVTGQAALTQAQATVKTTKPTSA